jgi:Tfp pilus assembly protein FimV
MPEEVKPASEPTAQESAPNSEPSLKDMLTQLEAIKQAQSGSDRKVKELMAALSRANEEKESLVKERMSDKEKAAYELEQRTKALQEKDAEIQAKVRALTKSEVVSELEVPKILAPRVQGATKDEMVADAKALLKAWNEAVTVEVNKRLLEGSVSPKAGEPATIPGKYKGRDLSSFTKDEVAKFSAKERTEFTAIATQTPMKE